MKKLININDFEFRISNFEFFKRLLAFCSFLIAYCLLPISTKAQENIYPTPTQKGSIAIVGGNIHVGNGKVFKGSIKIENGKITSVSEGTVTADKTIDATGKEIYPGVIAPSTNLGLVEVGAVRATADFNELGDINPNIRSIVAYNTESKIINTIRSNGVLLAHIVPSGGSISGTSSVVQLDAWNYEDASYKADNGIHYNMPALINRPSFGGRRQGGEQVDMVKLGLERIENTRKFFREAKAYLATGNPSQINLKYEAVKGLFTKTQTFFVHCDLMKEMMIAIDFAKEFDFKLCIVGGSDSWMITDILKQNNTAVILSEPHSLPNTNDDDVDQPYKTGAVLQKAGVLFTICQDAGDGFWQQRSLPFQAGTMAAYGLTKEEALTAITFNAAKILGVDDKTGTIENGKDANIVISTGDLLDMKTNNVTNAFIQGREISLESKHTQLAQKYKYKYGIK